MPRQRDTQRSRLYKSEGVLKQYSKALPEIADMVNYLKPLLASKAVRKDILDLSGRPYFSTEAQRDLLFRPPLVKDGRGRWATACGDARYIKMPRHFRTDHMTLHETAHSLTARLYGPYEAWHGENYATVYLQLVKHGMGKEAYQALRSSFVQNKIKFRA